MSSRILQSALITTNMQPVFVADAAPQLPVCTNYKLTHFVFADLSTPQTTPISDASFCIFFVEPTQNRSRPTYNRSDMQLVPFRSGHTYTDFYPYQVPCRSTRSRCKWRNYASYNRPTGNGCALHRHAEELDHICRGARKTRQGAAWSNDPNCCLTDPLIAFVIIKKNNNPFIGP